MRNRKLYLARFTQKKKYCYCRKRPIVFYKIGQCWQYDANERFLFDADQYEQFDIKIMTSAWGPADKVDEWEQRLLRIREKDFWLPEMFSGITECRQFTQSDLTYLFAQFKRLSNEWYKQRVSSSIG